MKESISLRRQLDEILGSRAKVSVLRVLNDGRPELNGREVARRAGLASRSAQLALASLTRIGIVQMRAVGNNHVFSVNPEFNLYKTSIQAAFAAEKAGPEALAQDLIRHLRGEPILTLAWFGSVARGQRDAGSDMDVLIVLKDSRASEGIRKALEGQAASLREKFGFRIELYVLGAKELARRFDSNDLLVRNMVKDAVLLHGKPLSEVLLDAP
ncbi:MAG: nucleotidyltransferase domain-containing protein [Elusimicrobia bacterium]|nr:nucleotidyltransferase domain-containing protein [Elusimicrobiota bacterium]